MRFELISFDLDGTLVDTASEIAEAANRTLQSHGLPRQPESEIGLLIGHGAHELMRKLVAKLCLTDAALAQRLSLDAMFETFDGHYTLTTGTTGAPYAGAHDALRRLRQHGIKLACVTNKELRHARRVLQVNDLADCFELVLGGDSLPQKKPHASVLRYVAATLGVKPEAMAHVGDSATDVEAARAAGVSAWAVPYGYNAGQPISSANPELIFSSLTEIAEHVLTGDKQITSCTGR